MYTSSTRVCLISIKSLLPGVSSQRRTLMVKFKLVSASFLIKLLSCEDNIHACRRKVKGAVSECGSSQTVKTLLGIFSLKTFSFQFSPTALKLTVRISRSHGALSDVSLDVPIAPGHAGAWQGWAGTHSLQQPVHLGKIFLFDRSDLCTPKENNTGLRLQQHHDIIPAQTGFAQAPS